MKLLFECHITCMTSQAPIAASVAEALKWKTSEIARDPVLGEDTYFYLTKYGDTYEDIFGDMKTTVRSLMSRQVRVVREKIELILHDKRNR